MSAESDMPGRWSNVRKLLEREGPFAHPDFQANPGVLQFLQKTCKVLVVGAGGLGCELLKNLAMLAFRDIHVIDMDTIDVSNLNRQFLFSHYAKIQDFGADFYGDFHLVVCGLDSVIARRWINGMLISLLMYNDDGELDQSTIIPFVDGGTEGFKGNVRVILPGVTACIECTLDLYPPQVNFPLCTIAHTPRLPEHCIEYVRILLWPKEEPFGDGAVIDGDNPEHIRWIFAKSTARADEHGICGVTYRLTQGVVKRIIPAVASTNAVIAAVCATEVFKLATSCYHPLSNYMNFNDTDGIYTYSFEAEKREGCAACSLKPQHLSMHENARLQDVVTYLMESSTYQMKSPGITTSAGGKNRTLYMQTVKSIEEKTRSNLKKTLTELGLETGQELYVADVTTPTALTFILNVTADMQTENVSSVVS